MADNVYATAKVIKEDESVKKYELSNFSKQASLEPLESHFITTNLEDSNNNIEEVATTHMPVTGSDIVEKIEPLYKEFQTLTSKIDEISQKIFTIEEEASIKNRALDEQVVKAIKDLKQYASFFEQASFQLESKILKTAITVAQKIINIEISEKSSKIAKQTITQLLSKIKGATSVKIHLNPKDFYILKQELELEPFIELIEDASVVVGGVVITSNLGNFDGTVEAKIASMLETLDLVI